MYQNFFSLLIGFSVCFNSVQSQTKIEPEWTSIDARPIPTWFEDAKFGIFIHWGPYSVPSYSPTEKDSVVWWNRYAEWYWKRWKDSNEVQRYFADFHDRVYGKGKGYQDFAGDFKAELFNPDGWAKRFKDAGAQYVVLTSKHHDGFALWPSKYSPNWNSVDVGSKRDLVAALSASVRNTGVRMGLYYSLKEWYHPFFNDSGINQYVDGHLIPQMKELVNDYKPDLLWTDGDGGYTYNALKSTQFISWLFNESPVKNKIVINDRWGKDADGKHGGFYTTEYGNAENKDLLQDKIAHPWEECRGMAGSFGYNRNENFEDYASSKKLIYLLVNTVARGGNLLLNIGPTADGRIPEIQQERLSQIGAWLKTNGEAIYGTRKWEKAPMVSPTSTNYFTKKGKDIYLIVTKWEEKPIVVEGVSKQAKVSLLGFEGKIKNRISDNKITILPPLLSPANTLCKEAWVYKLENGAIEF